ncbi:MAG: hypothetical protein MUF45_08320 [Spirosomaceae bacterium]|jgi:hypothetical protein|nr:hypothetical protein [Spirosomataceae bacterium]
MERVLKKLKSDLTITSVVYIALVFATSFFLWLPNRGLSRIINQIPIAFILLFYGTYVKRPYKVSDYISIIILCCSPVFQLMAHILVNSKQQEIAAVLDIVFILIIHSLLIVLFRFEGGVAITGKKNDLKTTFPILVVMILLFGIILMNNIPTQFVIVFVLFIGLILVLTATFINRRVEQIAKKISSVGLLGIISCDYIALYSKAVDKFPYSFEIYRALYFIGIYLIITGSLINTELNLSKKSKSKDLHIRV